MVITMSDMQTVTMPGMATRIFRPLYSLVGYVLIFGACLFISSGRIDWTMAWAYLALEGCYMAVNSLILTAVRPELIAERVSIKKDTRGWDKALAVLIVFASLAICVVAGLDIRFGWSSSLPIKLSLIALVVSVPGHLMFLWAMASNRFFAATVRIQKERGHAAVTRGPYRYVRHPAYAGSIIVQLMAPVILGSALALIPAVLAVCLIIVRTGLEDRMLREELDGYGDFARTVRYRLFPGVW